MAETSEGAQEMAGRTLESATSACAAGRVLRLSRPTPPPGRAGPGRDQTMIMNMGPQHPSTHGVLRLMLELEGEKVLRTSRSSATHTGMEKTGEDLTLPPGPHERHPHGLRLAPVQRARVVVHRAALGIEVPPRAVWIRMLMCELNRLSSHLLFMATNGMDLGGRVDDDLRLARARGTLRIEKITGLRMNHNYIRPGGVAADLPDGWRDDVLRLLELIPPRPRSTTP